MRIELLGLLLAFAPCAAMGQTIYKCEVEGKPTLYQSEPCPAGAASKAVMDYSSEAARTRAESAAGQAATRRWMAWEKLCGEGPPSYVTSCASGHSSDYEHMMAVRKNAGTSEANLSRANACFLQWFKESINEVDARMWRYCYYH